MESVKALLCLWLKELRVALFLFWMEPLAKNPVLLWNVSQAIIALIERRSLNVFLGQFGTILH